MRFTKMHGAGNDYVYVNCFEEPIPDNPAEVARLISDRHRGVGGDGLILICPSQRADAQMRMFNADGSEAEMCGNGIRCLGKFLFDNGLTRKTTLQVDTGRGLLKLHLFVEGDHVHRVRVDMGRPILSAREIPTTLAGDPIINAPLKMAGQTLDVTCVSMGNPHCITFVERLSDDWVLKVGPQIESDPHFPSRVNAEFVEIISPGEVRARVWERGSGETLACGTGAAAICVAGVLTSRTDRRLKVQLPGGELELEWAKDDHVYMTGPAVEVFSGQWEPPSASPLDQEQTAPSAPASSGSGS